ncbi:MAG: DUF4258 domain-containing protein [Spirochaetales bacterium]|nr:DUF4258 domain-containing protein [Spirochaetales bacterium]
MESKNINLKKIQELCKEHKIRWTRHILTRLIQRGISQTDVENAIMNGRIIEQYADDYPVPSCLILGKTEANRSLHICCSSNEEYIWMITAYYPSSESWNENFDTRKKTGGIQ